AVRIAFDIWLLVGLQAGFCPDGKGNRFDTAVSADTQLHFVVQPVALSLPFGICRALCAVKGFADGFPLEILSQSHLVFISLFGSFCHEVHLSVSLWDKRGGYQPAPPRRGQAARPMSH